MARKQMEALLTIHWESRKIATQEQPYTFFISIWTFRCGHILKHTYTPHSEFEEAFGPTWKPVVPLALTQLIAALLVRPVGANRDEAQGHLNTNEIRRNVLQTVAS